VIDKPRDLPAANALTQARPETRKTRATSGRAVVVIGPMHSRLHAQCACSSLGAPFVLAGTSRKYERSRPFTVRHLFLDLRLDVPKKSVEGTATLDIERLSPRADTLVLDAVGFDIASVEVATGRNFRHVDHTYDGDRIVISGLEDLSQGKVRVSYRATPARGLYFLAPDKHVKDRPRQVWSQCQDEDARHWFPCLDKPHVKMTSELRVTVPSGWVALSNGEQRKVERKKGKAGTTFHFELDRPHPAYLVTLVAGEFAVVTDRPARLGPGKSVPVTYYVPPKRKADAKRSLGETPRMIELFTEKTGVPFPWSRYSQIVVSDFIFGGMENTTATTLYEHVLVDQRAAIDVSSHDLVAHELAHQWFGDYVTCRDWSHGWLNEGFATFFEHVEIESRLGRDEYEWGVTSDLEAYLAEAHGRYQRPIVCRDYQEPIDLFDRHLYQKGGLVLHLLRRMLGDEVFWTGIRLYLERHAHGIVETNDLMRALEEVSGESLEQFFDTWVYRPGHPELKIKISWDDGLLSVETRQKQKGHDVPTFVFSLEVLVVNKDGSIERHEKAVNEATTTLTVKLAERPRFVVFDPEYRIVGDLKIEAPADMLRRQLADGPTGRSRWVAAAALGKRDDPATVAALAKSLRAETEAWMVRAEAARALGRIRSTSALAALIAAARTPNPKVRRAVAYTLGRFKDPRAARLLTTLAKSDKSYLVAADAARALGRSRQPGALKALIGLLDQPSWADSRRAGALDGLGALRDEAGLRYVIERTRYGIPTRGRRAAVAALAQLSDSRKSREHLSELLEDKDPHFRIAVVDALSSLGDTRARGPLRAALDHELDGRVARRIREALRDLGDAGSGERKRLGDELETLRGELSELKGRISAMEALRERKKPKEAAPPREGPTRAEVKTRAKRRRAKASPRVRPS
jgi:aminopeptidase N